jgi:hypothetical protein
MADKLFPIVEKYIEDNNLYRKMKGNEGQLYRIQGLGKTKAKGLDFAPAEIERKMELVSFKAFEDSKIPLDVKEEIADVRRSLENETAELKKYDVQRRMSNQVLRGLDNVQCGNKDNHFYAGRLILKVDKSGKNWAWCMTSYYPIISNIPPDIDYITKSYYEAERLLSKIIIPAELFDHKLNLAWTLASRFSQSDKILIIDVARMYKIAGQSDQFWNQPKKSNYVDLPEAAFIANLINWRRQMGVEKSEFTLSQATMHQTIGPNAKVFYMPSNPEGTQTRPVIYITKRNI